MSKAGANLNKCGIASMEAILFSVFVLLPLFVLSLALLQRAAASQNSIASARHGAFRETMKDAKHYEDRVGLGAGSYRTEDEIKKNIAYFPDVRGKILQRKAGASDRSTVTATMRITAFSLDYDRQLDGTNLASQDFGITQELMLLDRKPKHYDNAGAPMHSVSSGAMGLFLLEVKGLQGAALVGPIPFTPF